MVSQDEAVSAARLIFERKLVVLQERWSQNLRFLITGFTVCCYFFVHNSAFSVHKILKTMATHIKQLSIIKNSLTRGGQPYCSASYQFLHGCYFKRALFLRRLRYQVIFSKTYTEPHPPPPPTPPPPASPCEINPPHLPPGP